MNIFSELRVLGIRRDSEGSAILNFIFRVTCFRDPEGFEGSAILNIWDPRVGHTKPATPTGGGGEP